MRDKTWVFLTAVLLLCPCVTAQAQNARIARLIDQLGDLDFDKQDDARQQLEKLGEPARLMLRDAVTKHADGEVREQAQAILMRMNATKVSRLIKKLGDADAGTRGGAEKELTQIVKAARSDEGLAKEAMKRLVRVMAKRPAKDVEECARRVLTAGVNLKRVRELIKQLGDDEYERRESATIELIHVGWGALEELKKALKDPDRETRNRAKRAIEAITKDQ